MPNHSRPLKSNFLTKFFYKVSLKYLKSIKESSSLIFYFCCSPLNSPGRMAPSATSEIVVPELGVAKQVEKQQHAHGAEDKTPLEAISHGPIVQAGMTVSLFVSCSSDNAA
jgi:hypothetical protein